MVLGRKFAFMKKCYENDPQKTQKKIKIIRVNSCNSWASFFHTSPGEAAASCGAAMELAYVG